jgi:hypothetical protein
MLEGLSDFGAWVGIVGSDDAVRAFHNMMQGAFHNAPAQVTLRLYAEFLLAARRDMGDNLSTLTGAELLGIRVNDLYDTPENLDMARMSFDELCAKHGWNPPWCEVQGS